MVAARDSDHTVERKFHLAQARSHARDLSPVPCPTGNITPFVGLLGTVMGSLRFREIGTKDPDFVSLRRDKALENGSWLFTPSPVCYNTPQDSRRHSAWIQQIELCLPHR